MHILKLPFKLSWFLAVPYHPELNLRLARNSSLPLAVCLCQLANMSSGEFSEVGPLESKAACFQTGS